MRVRRCTTGTRRTPQFSTTVEFHGFADVTPNGLYVRHHLPQYFLNGMPIRCGIRFDQCTGFIDWLHSATGQQAQTPPRGLEPHPITCWPVAVVEYRSWPEAVDWLRKDPITTGHRPLSVATGHRPHQYLPAVMRRPAGRVRGRPQLEEPVPHLPEEVNNSDSLAQAPDALPVQVGHATCGRCGRVGPVLETASGPVCLWGRGHEIAKESCAWSFWDASLHCAARAPPEAHSSGRQVWFWPGHGVQDRRQSYQSAEKLVWPPGRAAPGT